MSNFIFAKREISIKNNIIYMIFSTGISAVFSFLCISILVKKFDLETVGYYFLAQSYVGIFSTIFAFQSFNAIIKYLPSAKKSDLEIKSIKMALIFDVITAIITIFFALLFLKPISMIFQWNSKIKVYINICIFTCAFPYLNTINGIFRVYEKYKYIAIVSITQNISLFILYIMSIKKIENISVFFYYNVISIIIGTIISFILLFKTLGKEKFKMLLKEKKYYEKSYIKFNILNNISNIIDLPITSLLPIIMSRYIDISSVAIYKILEKIGSMILIITGSISNVVSPEISICINNGKINKAIELSKKIAKKVISFGILAVILICVSYKYWYQLIFPINSDYLISLILFLVFIIYTSSFMGLHPIFIYTDHMKENVYILLVVNIAYLLFVTYFTKRFGINGVIFSRIIQATNVYLAKLIILRREKKI